ncbi:MAG: YdiU family protein [Rhodocyclaceae bacterium]|nr:YdiU family protein [Rhodocyclaceae bacterium]MBX3666961.1 YdiU family protein [Rhodocyclaceae bacterium]
MPHPRGATAPRSLETLPWVNSFARLAPAFYTRLEPWQLPDPYLVCASAEVAKLIGLSAPEIARPEFVQAFCGNLLLPGTEPLAAVYSGHQFGTWAGQLGDGRAHLLGEVRGTGGNWEIQLKGAGRTPYSRFADGRAVLRSSIREYLCSEAMAGLGIATTRALCIVGSDAPVQREMVETAAVVTRVAPSFVRFGSFEHWRARGRVDALRELADHVIDRFRPELRDADQAYVALLADVSRRTGELLARWMGVGFMHGVMNTDNMSILGLTLDYGPFGFMEAFDAKHICNHSDDSGRYAYAAQPHVAQWNLYALAEALLPLIGAVDAARDAVDTHFTAAYNEGFLAIMRGKFGFTAALARDEQFISDTLNMLQFQRPDFTLFFRNLSQLSATAQAGADAPLRDLFLDPSHCDAWLADWRARLAQEASQDAARQAAMKKLNPKYVLRNWLAETAIRKARDKDFSEVTRLQACLAHPYDEQPEFEAYAALPPDWANGLAVSCSS